MTAGAVIEAGDAHVKGEVAGGFSLRLAEPELETRPWASSVRAGQLISMSVVVPPISAARLAVS